MEKFPHIFLSHGVIIFLLHPRIFSWLFLKWTMKFRWINVFIVRELFWTFLLCCYWLLPSTRLIEPKVAVELLIISCKLALHFCVNNEPGMRRNEHVITLCRCWVSFCQPRERFKVFPNERKTLPSQNCSTWICATTWNWLTACRKFLNQWLLLLW